MSAAEPLLPPELAIDEPPFDDLALDDHLGLLPGHITTMRSDTAARFVVDNDDKAEWAMAHVARIDAERAELQARRQAYLERIESWFERDVSKLNARRDFFLMHLTAYLRARREADDKVKSISLPSGTVTSRSSKPKLMVTDEEAALAYIKANYTVEQIAEAVKVTERLLVSKLDGLVAIEDGRAVDPERVVPLTSDVHLSVPGLGVESAKVTYDVKPNL